MIGDDDDPLGQHQDQDQDGDEAEVIDLDPARRRHAAGGQPEPDTTGDADGGQDEDEDEAWDDDDDERVLVDSPEAQQPGPLLTPDSVHAAMGATSRRPIIPPWARSWSAFTDTTWWWIRYWAYTLTWHATRSPKYAALLVVRAPRGAARASTRAARWALDTEGHPARIAMVSGASVRVEEAHAYLRLSAQRDQRVRARAIGAVLLLLASAGACGWLWLRGAAWMQWTTLAATIMTLGLVGAPADRPLLDTPVAVSRPFKLTSDVVARALGVLGIQALATVANDPQAIRQLFPEPIRQDGPGWRAVINLPHGTTANEVIDKRDKLASGLDRPLGCVWPEAAPQISPRRLVLWVGDKDMATARQPAWPLLRAGTVDLFRPFPFGTDPRGRLVEITIMFASMVIGSVPRMGKSFAARLIALAAALDVRCELHLYDLRGTGDFSPLESVCHRYRAGDDDDDIAYLLSDLRELQADLRRRNKTIREQPRDLCPENKVTPQLASRRSLRLHPIVIWIDECQRAYEHPRYGAEIAEICEDLVRRGPGAGIFAGFSTQRPDAKSLPSGISANAVLRFCLKVIGHLSNDMVLGTGTHKAGIRATMFTRRDLGIGWLLGEGDDAKITRSFCIDGLAAERVAARARALREQAGTLSGHAIGQDAGLEAATGSATASLLADVLAVTSPAEEKVWCQTAADRLAELRPEVYGGWAAEQVTVALKPYGVAVQDVWGTDPATGKTTTRRGVVRQHVLDAATQRRRQHGEGGPQ